MTRKQIEQFMTKGYVILKGCFPKAAAARLVARAYERMGLDPNKPEGWKELDAELPEEQGFEVRQFAPRAWQAICELVGGAPRIAQGEALSWADRFIVRFPAGGKMAWEPPERAKVAGWHIDAYQQTRFLDSPEAGLICLAIWDKVAPRGGGTILACDSVGKVAKAFKDHPEGLAPSELTSMIPRMECKEFFEFSGEAGDVVLMHPFMLHGQSRNHSSRPRFLTVRVVELAQPLRFEEDRPGGLSILERSILRSLGLKSLDFKRAGPSKRS